MIITDLRGNGSGRSDSFRFARARRLVERAEAVRADKHALAVHGRVLQIGVFAGPVHRVVVAAQKLAGALHL